jgi:hypothetical protein
MDVRQCVTVSILAVCIQLFLLVESTASTNQYSNSCTKAVRSTASSCFGITSIVCCDNMPTKTSSSNIWIHRYFRACKHFHEVVDNSVCLSSLLIISLARSSMLCDAVLCNLCLLACMCVWILGMDCGNRAGKNEIRHPISEARLPPSFFALVWHQQSVCSIQCAACHQFGESGMRWVSQVQRNTGG